MKIFQDNYSRGCQSCQEGKWLCIYLTYLCPANCSFCPSPYKSDKIDSAFGNKKEIIANYVKNYGFNSIGFSGGDPFVKFNRLIDWLYYFKTELPDFYLWAYTSGITLSKKQLDIAAKSGLNEIRFNIAATGYDSEDILEILEYAVKIVPYVAVEIPSIQDHTEKLKKILPVLNTIGVKYLNLHEYVLVNECEANENQGDFMLNRITPIKYSRLSQNNTRDIIEFCCKNQLEIKVNNCSLEKKEEQLRQRRLKMGAIVKAGNDIMNEDGIIIRNIAVQGRHNFETINDQIAGTGYNEFIKKMCGENHLNSGEVTSIQLELLPPLGLEDDFRLLKIKKV
jgi:uncharacterized protein